MRPHIASLAIIPLAALLLAAQQSRKPLLIGALPESGYVVATRQLLHPAGESVSFAGRPVDLAFAPDEKTLYVKASKSLVVLDPQNWRVRQQLAINDAGASMHGLAVSADGRRLYASTAQDALLEANIRPSGALDWGRRIPLPGPGGRSDSHATGIALSADGRRAYVCLSRNNSLAIVDLDAGEVTREIPVGVAPFDVTLAKGGRIAYVSDWGGRHPEAGEEIANSSGTQVLIDERGIVNDGQVSIVDLNAGKELKQIKTGLHPSDLELSADGRRLYVANANSDTVSVIDTKGEQVVETISVRPRRKLPFGSAPNALALSPDGETLYVANGGNNALAVIRLPRRPGERSRVRGFIPTAWYPGGVAARGKQLFIVNVKGYGSRNPREGQNGWSVYQYLGVASRVETPSPGVLKKYTAQALADARVRHSLDAGQPARAQVAPRVVPRRPGEPSRIKHVVYIIKENRTYDQVFGDLKQANGDPTLCTFGREVTPNHHALAEQFAILDNYYCNGVLSADGHSWVTEGHVTDHLEKSFGGFTRSYMALDDAVSHSSSGFIWDNVLTHGRTYRNYGEMVRGRAVPSASFKAMYDDFRQGTGRYRISTDIAVQRVAEHSHPGYPGFNLAIPDVLRADLFIKDLKKYERQGEWANFVIVYLPNDHTSGTRPGRPTPRAQVADNDLALGQVVEAISRSKFWPETAIFVEEDDPQNGYDHVDGHRSLCLVISPYTRRGSVVSEFYNQTSVLHTMELMLGLPPMNQLDGQAPPMTACFTEKPNLTPYKALPNRVPLDEMNPKMASLSPAARRWARLSLAQPLDVEDRADEDALNRIIWHSVKGTGTPYPARLAGAHGRGLKALGLTLGGDEDDDD